MPIRIEVPAAELFNEMTGEFSFIKGQTISLEHSLVSISKWESKWKKSYLNVGPETPEEALDYIRCMTTTQNVDPNLYMNLSSKDLDRIQSYIEDSMTATTFPTQQNRRVNREIVTAEVIYYWMTVYNIPFECQKWHINRLMTLIRVCNAKESPQKMSKRDIMSQNKELNKARRMAKGSKG